MKTLLSLAIAAACSVPFTTFAAKAQVSTEVIVVLREAPVATYSGSDARFHRVPQRTDKPGRMDMKSPQAISYAAHLSSAQDEFLERISDTFDRQVAAKAKMQHALNAVILNLTPEELEAVRADPEVLLVEERRDVPYDTDAGPNFIGAAQLWFGQPGATTQSLFSNGVEGGFGIANRGEGVIIGVVDSGANQDSPSFADPSPDGYDHNNPLAGSQRLGWCNAGTGTTQAECNDKMLGAWDFVDGSTPGAQCLPGTFVENPGIEDENGHGTHTASTSAGNPRDSVVVPGIPTLNASIAGVAPRANLVVFDVCYTCNTADQVGAGLCPNTATAQAFNQAVIDNVVDVMNFSIGGGNSPWSDATSLAMLSAHNAGILVSASAGNSGPLANTLGHREPWTMTVAASTHDRAFFGAATSALTPTPPAAVQNVPGVFGETSPTTSVNGALRHSVASPQGCLVAGANPFPAGFFTGAIAVMDRGSCTFSEKITNAVGAGAIGVIMRNSNPAAPIIMGAAGNAVPSIMVTQSAGAALRDFAIANPVNTGQIGSTTGIRSADPAFGDVMAGFSSRGPSSSTGTPPTPLPFIDSVKPDVSGPGVSILAASSGAANSLAFLQGTSMSSPHAAGAAALVRGARPTWTPMEVKSAMVMTGKTSMLKENGVAPSDPFDRGGGRIQPFLAAKAGLVLNETGANFSAANPAASGNPTTLNLPSLGNDLCNPNCAFTRNFRSSADTQVTWEVSFTGVTASALPASFTVGAGANQSVTFTVDGTALTTTFSFGQVVLTPSNPALPVLRIPIAVRR